jgi:polyphenol oxidase
MNMIYCENWRNVMADPEPLFFLSSDAGVLCLFTKKFHGNMKYGGDGGRNQKAFASKYLQRKKLFLADVQHGNRVYVLDYRGNETKNWTTAPRADAIVTNFSLAAIAVTGADCYPVYFYDLQKRVIGVAHCSSKSTMRGVIQNTVHALVGLGGDITTLVAFIGPGICRRCYDYGEDAYEVFKGYERFIFKSGQLRLSRQRKHKVDLEEIIYCKLREAGIDSSCILRSDLCTYGECGAHEERFNLFSARRDKTDPIQAGMAVIALR